MRDSTPITKQQVIAAARRIADAIVESVAAAGEDGCAESTVFLALQAHGGTLEHHRAFIDALVGAGRLRRDHDRLYVVARAAR